MTAIFRDMTQRQWAVVSDVSKVPFSFKYAGDRFPSEAKPYARGKEPCLKVTYTN